MCLFCVLLFIVCVVSVQVVIQICEMFYWSVDGMCMVGYFVYDDSKLGICFGVIVVYEWWGFNDYVKCCVCDFVEFGYSVLVIDMYGEGKYIEYLQDVMVFMQVVIWDVDVVKVCFFVGLELLKW